MIDKKKTILRFSYKMSHRTGRYEKKYPDQTLIGKKIGRDEKRLGKTY